MKRHGSSPIAFNDVSVVTRFSYMQTSRQTTYMEVMVKPDGLSVVYSNPIPSASPGASGVFDIYLSSTKSGGGTTGICGVF